MTRRRAGSLSSLRELNRLKVLEVVRERGTVSRAEIAIATGLARSTVSTLVGELQRARVVVEREDTRAGGPASSGRPPLMISLDPGACAVIGIQLDHDFVRVAIADLSLTLLAEGETVTVMTLAELPPPPQPLKTARHPAASQNPK